MNSTRYYALTITAIVAVLGLYMVGVSYAQHNHMMSGCTMQASPKTGPAQDNAGLQAIYSQQLPAIQATVERAIQHLQAGHRQEALSEMKQVQSSLAALHQALGRQVGPQFLNNRCPIQGAKIDPAKVPAELTRVYGQGKVAFCCGGCPDQWDRLTEAQKTAKLKTVANQAQLTPQATP